jgi:hypothetical protein
MKKMSVFSELDKQRYNNIWKMLETHFDEKNRRLLASAMSLSLGYGGSKVIRSITNLNSDTIKLGIEQLTDEIHLDNNRIRRQGGGRKTIISLNPNMETDLLRIIEADTQGDPESPLLWTSKSLENLKSALKDLGYSVSLPVISAILAKNEYSMQANKKRFEGVTADNRDSQFEYINETVKEAMKLHNPVISVDSKKKENVGNYKNGGREYHKTKDPIEVNAYDFIDKKFGKVTPYGIYDIAGNNGWVNAGCDHDTAEFAVFSIEQWWSKLGKTLYPNANELIITADGGGSNSSVSRLWKFKLQELSNRINLSIKVCHFPPGTSKWNKIEHRMFSAISMNWRGRPLTSHEIIIKLISNTTNKSGLKIFEELDDKIYEKGIKITDKQISTLNIEYHNVNRKLNYTIKPVSSVALPES